MRSNTLNLLLLLTALSAIPAQKTKNFIYVVPDGYGLTSQVLARDYHAFDTGVSTETQPNSTAFGVDSMVIGTVRTHSLDKRITDSAAAATAFACGVKTNNGAVGVTRYGDPQGSILEAAHLAGMKTGLIATSRITHATPAGYSSHVRNRNQESEIAAQQIGKTHPLGPFVDILMGGGRDHFLPKAKGGKRTDKVDLIKWAKDKAGYTYAHSKKDLVGFAKGAGVPLPFLGLFAPSHLEYEVDRKHTAAKDQPSLLDMTKIAISTLQTATGNSTKGFFIMIEASRIDHAGHANDAAAHIQEVLMYNNVMAYLRDFVSSHPDTQLLSAADHECGGLTLEDDYNPSKLQPAMRSSAHYIIEEFNEKNPTSQTLLSKNIDKLGIPNGLSAREKKIFGESMKYSAGQVEILIGQMLSKRAGVHWSTTQHSAVDVALYGYASPEMLGEMKKAVGGNIDNTDIPKYIEKVLRLSMGNVTEILRKNDKKNWVGMVKRANSSQCG